MPDERPVVADTGPLIALAAVGHFDLLKLLYREILVPPAVAREVAQGAPRPGARELAAADWVRTVAVDPPPDPFLVAELDGGEAEAIALAVQLRATLLVLDERRGRQIAELVYGLPIRGTVGTLALARRRGALHAIRPVLEDLRRAGMYLSDALIERVCRELGE